MNALQEPAIRSESTRRRGRLMATAAIMGGLAFLTLWLMAFSALTSLLAASACCAVLIAASALSDPFEMVLDAVCSAILGVLSVVATIVAALFDVFD